MSGTVATDPAAKPPGGYRRLPGRSRSWLNVGAPQLQRLYLGEGDLVVVNQVMFHEKHKRFQLADIEAILVDPSNDGRNINLMYGGMALVFLSLGLLLGNAFEGIQDESILIGGALFSGIGFAGIALNSIFGPTCRVTLCTRVNAEELTAVKRYRTARRLLGEVVPALEAAQGVAGLQDMLEPGAEIPVPARSQDPATKPKPEAKTPLPPYWHAALFSMVLVSSLYGFAQLSSAALRNSEVATVLDLAVMILGVGTLLGALVAQSQHLCSRDLFWITWFAAGLYAVTTFTYMALAFYYAIEAGESDFSTIDWLDIPVIQELVIASSIAEIVIAAFGFIALRRNYRFAPGRAIKDNP